MKTLLLLAALGFVLSVGYALPFGEDEAQNEELKDIASDFETDNQNSDYGMNKDDDEFDDEDFDDEDFDDDDNDRDKDETAEDDEDPNFEDYENEIVEDNEDRIYEHDDDDDDDDAVEKLSDPRPFNIGRVFKSVQRAAIHVGRKIARTAVRVGHTVRRTVLRVVPRGVGSVRRTFRSTVKHFRLTRS